MAQQAILFGRSYISEVYLQNSKETVQCNNLSQSSTKIQCMHLKCWGKNQTFQGCSGLLLHWKYVEIKQTKMFCSLPAMTLRALNESHLVCAVRFRQRRSIYKELYIKSTQNRSLEKSV